jgi:hypothetical protein
MIGGCSHLLVVAGEHTRLYPPSGCIELGRASLRLQLENIGGCSLLLVVARELGSWSFPQVVA